MTIEPNVANNANKESTDVPIGWPDNVKYLRSNSLPSANLPYHLQLHLCTAPKNSHECHPEKAKLQDWTTIKLITKDIPFEIAFGSKLTTHPTIGQYGLFALRDIPPNTLVVPYLGIVHLSSDEDAESRYDAAIEGEDGTRCGIDATRAGNEARFVNDYRGILRRPNLFFNDWSARFPEYCKIQSGNGTENEVRYPKKIKGLALYSGAHSIKRGTELCASYGKGWWAARAG